MAVMRDLAEIVRLLLQHPEIDINAVSKNGDTLLDLATRGKYAAIIKLILQHENVNLEDKEAILKYLAEHKYS